MKKLLIFISIALSTLLSFEGKEPARATAISTPIDFFGQEKDETQVAMYTVGHSPNKNNSARPTNLKKAHETIQTWAGFYYTADEEWLERRFTLRTRTKAFHVVRYIPWRIFALIRCWRI